MFKIYLEVLKICLEVVKLGSKIDRVPVPTLWGPYPFLNHSLVRPPRDLESGLSHEYSCSSSINVISEVQTLSAVDTFDPWGTPPESSGGKAAGKSGVPSELLRRPG